MSFRSGAGSSLSDVFGRVFSRRLLVILIVAACVVGGTRIENRTQDNAVSFDSLQEVGAGTNALSSSWYCPLVSSVAADAGAGGVTLVNYSPEPLNVTATVFDATSSDSTSSDSTARLPPTDAALTVEGFSRTVFNPGNVVDFPLVSVLLLVDGGGVAAEHYIRDVNGQSVTPCSSRASSDWFIADASTEQTDLRLGLFNPFPEEAIVDIAANTDAGRAQLEQYRGIVVPARSSLVINVGEELRRRQWLQLGVSARVGRVVVDQLQTGTLRGAPGISLSLATPVPARSWVLPPGVVSSGVTDRITLFNPGDREVEARLSLLPEGDFEIIESTLFVPPDQRVARDLELEVSVPRDVPIAARIETDGGELVVSRTATAVAPSASVGFDISQSAGNDDHSRWVLVGADTIDPSSATVGFVNRNPVDAQVTTTIVGNGTSSPGPTVTVPAGRDAFIVADTLGLVGNQSLVFESSVPITAASRVALLPGAGLTSRSLIPVR